MWSIVARHETEKDAIKMTKVIITMDSGMIQNIFTDGEAFEAIVVNYDTDYATKDEFKDLVQIDDDITAWVEIWNKIEPTEKYTADLWKRVVTSPIHPDPESGK